MEVRYVWHYLFLGILFHSTLYLFNILFIQQFTYLGDLSKSDTIQGAGRRKQKKDRHGWCPHRSYSLTGKRLNKELPSRDKGHAVWVQNGFGTCNKGNGRTILFLKITRMQQIDSLKIRKSKKLLSQFSEGLVFATYMYIYILYISCPLILKSTLPSRYIFLHLSRRKFKLKVLKVADSTHTHHNSSINIKKYK